MGRLKLTLLLAAFLFLVPKTLYGDAKPIPVVFNAVLTNTNQIKEIFYKNHLRLYDQVQDSSGPQNSDDSMSESIDRAERKITHPSGICGALGYGCIIVTYTDSSKVIHTTPPPDGSRGDLTTAAFNYDFDIGDGLELQSFLDFEERFSDRECVANTAGQAPGEIAAHLCNTSLTSRQIKKRIQAVTAGGVPMFHCDPDEKNKTLCRSVPTWAANNQTMTVPQYNKIDLQEVFKKENFYDKDALIKADRQAVRNAFDKLLSGSSDKDQFLRDVMLHPLGFTLLPELYQKVVAKQLQALIPIVEEASSTALLLTIEGLSGNADFHYVTYPYNDTIVDKTKMLNISKLYEFLRPQNLWPNFRALTPEVRHQLGGVYLEKVSGRQKAKARCTLGEQRQTIWLDYETPFFENVFVLYHELFHVAWEYIGKAHDLTAGVVGLLKGYESSLPQSPGNDPAVDETIRKNLLSLVSINELLAVDQQVRLYHAFGALVDSWSESLPFSARAWHNAYLGPQILKLLKSKTEIKSLSASEHRDLFKALVSGGLWLYADQARDAVHDELLKNRTFSYEANWAHQAQAHLEYFGKVYFDQYDPSEFMQMLKDQAIPWALGDSQWQIFPPFEYSCPLVGETKRILGPQWQFGIPFRIQILPDDASCLQSEGSHGGNDGSHGGEDGGFPSLEGPP